MGHREYSEIMYFLLGWESQRHKFSSRIAARSVADDECRKSFEGKSNNAKFRPTHVTMQKKARIFISKLRANIIFCAAELLNCFQC